MKVFVTDGAGFIGSQIVEHFQGRVEVRVLDKLRSDDRHNLPTRIPLREEVIAEAFLDRSGPPKTD